MAGVWLGRVTVVPVLVLVAWLVAGFPLLLAGEFTLVLVLVVAVPLAVVLVVSGVRWVPGRWRGAEPGAGRARTPWWAVAGVLVVAAAFGVHQLIYHSEQIIIDRDPASYIQFGAWIAGHGSLPIPQSRAAFGGTHHVLSFASFAFYQVGGVIVPQFMAGLPMVLAAGFWAGGVGTAVLMGPLLGAGAVLTFGGLAARLAGPRWAPLAALVLAVCLPEQFTSRSTYSEPLAQILFLGGLCLVIDSLEADRAGARALAALGGLALGLVVLVRIDGMSDILPVVPYCGLLLIGRRRQALPLFAGMAAGVVYGLTDGLVLSRPYLASIKSSLVPLALVAGAVVAGTAVGVAVLRRRGMPNLKTAWLPNIAAATAVLVVAGFAVRPYVQTVRASKYWSGQQAMAYYQQLNHLPVDPLRLYYELSLHWVFWYIGVPAVVLGTLGAAVLARRCLQGRVPAWVLPFMVFAWIIVTVLYRPAITPDQPWASRRLVPGVLPGFILLGVWAVGWLAGWLRRRGSGRVTRGVVVSGCAAVLVLPAAVTAFGLGIKGGGPLGVRLVADGLGFKTTYSGEIAAVDGMCAAIPHRSSVVIIDPPTGRGFAPLIRGMCGDPVAMLNSPTRTTVTEVVHGIEQAGRRPVLLAGARSQLTPYGGTPKETMKLRTTQDIHALVTPPLDTAALKMNVWMSEPSS